jgi:hypothetical protein
MAKNSTKIQGASRIRLVVLEAEGDGDLSQIAHAVQSALRPRDNIIPSARRVGTTIERAAPEVSEAEEVNDFDAESVEARAPQTGEVSKRTKTWTPAKPKVLNNIDFTTDPSFKAFAAQKSPQNNLHKYLVVAAWFKLHRNTDAITFNHVYNCFRHVEWTTDIKDFSQPLRSLKSDHLMDSGKNKGEYAINHLGLSKVDKLGKSKA